MKSLKSVSLFSVLAAILVIILTACSSQSEEKNIRIGSKDFTENLVVAEVYTLALEDKGYTVDRNFSIASSVVHTSLINDEIDLYPEYTGTGLLSVLGMDMQTDPQAVYDTVKSEYEKQFQLTWLDYAPASDSQGLVIRTDVAKKLGISTISDLQKYASELRFASQGEFDERVDGLAGLSKTYGDFNWKSSDIYDNSLKYTILKNNEADVTPAYTTEGQLINTDLYTLLTDDKQFWPPYNIAPVVRDDILETNPEIADILNAVSAQLTTEKITELNAKVDVDGEDYETVSADFYATIKESLH